MLFVEFRFLLFFLVVFSVHWTLLVLWGGLHGGALIFHREWRRLMEKAGAGFQKILGWLAVPLTFYWVCLTWIFFRAAPLLDEKTGVLKATSLEMAARVFKAFTLFGAHGGRTFGTPAIVIFAALALVHWLNSRRVFTAAWQRLPGWAAAALLGAGTELVLLFTPVKYKAFIYFSVLASRQIGRGRPGFLPLKTD